MARSEGTLRLLAPALAAILGLWLLPGAAAPAEPAPEQALYW